MTEELQTKATENLNLLSEKEKVIEAEIESHRVALRDAKMRLKKVKALGIQLNKLLTT